MSSAPVPAVQAPRPQARWRRASVDHPAPWAGLAIAFMWLAVLVVGLWGGDIFSASAGGSVSRVPAVVVVAICALIGTWVIGRRAFGPAAEVDELRTALDDERRAREALAAEVAELRAGARATPRAGV